MGGDRDERDQARGGSDRAAGLDGPAPGKRSLTQGSRRARAAGTVGKRTSSQGLIPIPAAGKGGGTPLPDDVRERMEAAFGADFSEVRIHEGGAAAELDAEAYAQGTDIHFAPGRYAPNSTDGLELLGHELTHVVQQAQGRTAQGSVHMKGVSVDDNSALEREADAHGASAARGQAVGIGQLGTSAGGSTVQRRVTVTPTPTARLDRVALLGDGTPAHPGLSVSDLNDYVQRQADWFSEPSVTAADRAKVWRLLLLARQGPHMSVALASLSTAEIAALPAGDPRLGKYAACFDSAAQTIQMNTAATTLGRALQLGQAIIDLEAFVPLPVMRVVIPERGLIFLVDSGKIPEFRAYYQTFHPTLETPAEWPHIELLLNENVGTYAALAPWIHDLHIFTPATRRRLVINVADRTRSRPVLLVLFSATDWNQAFLQAANMEGAILNGTNLALAIQGMPSIGAATAEVTRIANDYGQRTTSWDWGSWSMVSTPGRLGQVVIAGHGSDQSVEMASPGTNATARNNNQNVSYDEAPVDSSDPVANGTQLLIDTVLSRMDPADANVVFAGCLVGSHSVPASTDVSNAATAQANLQTALAAHPNLADYVRSRMAARGVTGTVQAANGSTTFDSFNVDAAGHAQLSNAGDPDIGGSKLQYVRTGIEPEGALRAAIECYADAAIGPAATTTEIRTRVAGLAGTTDWWETITRVGFELCLPAAPADVNIAKLLDLSHRISAWFFGGWADMIDVQWMANSVTAAEAPTVFPAMLATDTAADDYLKVSVPEAWMQHTAAQATPFMAALTASALTRSTFQPLLARGIVDPKLATLLPIGAPTKGQLLVALTIAVHDGASMPVPVRDFLRAAAGGTTTSTFPAALGVGPLILPAGELSVLEDIGLAPSSAPPTSGTTTVDANVDANHNGTNETFVVVSPREATVTATRLNIRRRATTSSPVIDTVSAGDVLRVMGETVNGWSFVDHDGKTGFVASRYLT